MAIRSAEMELGLGSASAPEQNVNVVVDDGGKKRKQKKKSLSSMAIPSASHSKMELGSGPAPPEQNVNVVVDGGSKKKKKKSSSSMAISSTSHSEMKLGSGSAPEQNVNVDVDQGSSKKKSSSSSSRRVKVVGNRVYDFVNGKTCHQCRQKTTKFTAACKNLKKGTKLCTLQFCENCLFARYGAIAREVAQVDNWACPKCCGVCNCSCCMKRRGQQPTGALFHTAKANGFKSVLDMLSANAAAAAKDLESNEANDAAAAKDLELNEANDADVLPSEETTVDKKQKCVDDDSRSEENLTSGAVSALTEISAAKELVVLLEGVGLMEALDATKCAELKGISTEDDVDGASKKKILEMLKMGKEVTSEEAKGNANDETEVCNEVSEEKAELESNHDNAGVPMDGLEAWAAIDFSSDVDNLSPNVGTNLAIGKMRKDIPFPPGTDLTEIRGIELPAESVGSALQLLEFCRVFGKVLNLKKGQPMAILREIVRKQSLRRGQSTLAVQFQIRMLTLIQKKFGTKFPPLNASDGERSWLKPLKAFIENSDEMKDFPVKWIQEGLQGYHDLDLSKKLTLLNFICDEALNTEKLRNFMDYKNSRHGEEKKKAKSKVAEAKEKEKGLRQTLQNEMAKVVLSNEAPRPMEEHDALLAKLKNDADQAHAEVLELSGKVPKGKNSDASRIEPEIFDSNGQAFWKFKSVDHALLLQDVKIDDETAAAPDEKWFVYGSEKMNEVNKYISSRAKILKSQKAAEKLLKRSM